MNTKELRCQVSNGMFSNERAITCQSLAGEISVFVPKEAVHENNGSSTVRVYAFRSPQAWGAILPTEDSLVIAVDQHELL